MREAPSDLRHPDAASLPSWLTRHVRVVAPAAGALVIGLVAIGALAGPEPWAPIPMTFVVPVFELQHFLDRRGFPTLPPIVGEEDVYWVPVFAVGSFLLTALPLFRRQVRRPLLSLALYVVAAAVDALFLIANWHEGAARQGPVYTLIVVAANTLLAVALALLALRLIRSPRAVTAWAFHIVLFLWLSWVAFPWLGELP